MTGIWISKMNIKGIYQGTTVKTYPPNRKTVINHGMYKGANIDVYSIYENDKITNKLYYVTDAIGWFKSKLKYFKDEKCEKVINSERKEKTYV